MAPKRTRRASPGTTGLCPGQRLKRAKLTGNASYSAWGWVGTEVTDTPGITDEYRLATCGFSRNSSNTLCPNKHAGERGASSPPKVNGHTDAQGEEELADDVIVISDDEGPTCGTKTCKPNPYCLNYLGQDKWENADNAYEGYLKVYDLGENPLLDGKDDQIPVGLKNLGATCYANAYLQVWFQDIPFRKGVYECQPAPDVQHQFEESPIFQLQVTFAAMQLSVLRAFNPVKLVESLKLRATEQQDAQEFSKLFMAHLDTEFKKQHSPELKELIPNQFQGKLVYNTVCQNCHRRSERDSDFLEIEVNLENNATLEERLSVFLEPETLSGDNKYLCQQCDSLHDAKRFTELRNLPPVLHFSLLRFVYDFSSMERKKSKQTILFPTYLDMDRFVGAEETRRQRKKKHVKESKNLYELRGILLHKGASAYHGHYEAQVFDVQNQGWYQFNDETVTKIESLVPKLDAGKKTGKGSKDTKKTPANQLPKGRPPKKRRRIDDSDSEIEIVENPESSQKGEGSPTKEGPDYISSKDAYMLVYARVGHKGSPEPSHPVNGNTSNGVPQPNPCQATPPAKALEVVSNLNIEHCRACDDYTRREQEAKKRFHRIRSTVADIYRTWNVQSLDEECVVASRQALESWLSRHIAKPKNPKSTPKPSTDALPKAEETAPKEAGSSPVPIPISGIVCSHGKLDPEKVQDMKAIKAAAHSRIAEEDGCLLTPRLTTRDVCAACVQRMFVEKLYQVEHPRLVSQFDDVLAQESDDGVGYYISKAWLKDWRLARPKMHVEGSPDPPPDAEEYLRDVVCEHDGLATNGAARKRISAEACIILQELFPNWRPPSSSMEQCAVCEALLHISKEDKREYRKQAEEEKARLKHMHDNALNGNTALLEDVPCAIVSSQFVRSWRQWVLRPGEVSRPETVDNSTFICEHGLLAFDPNVAGDLDTSMTIVKRNDWNALEELYSAGPLIAIENTNGKYLHELGVCSDCRLKRRTSFDMTEITLRVLGPSDPTPTPQNYSDELPSRSPAKPVQSTLTTYSKRQNEGSRKSKRIRQVREYGKRRKITITKGMSVKELKVMLNDELGIPVISQRLFYRGRELNDSSATMLSLGILSNDLLDLKEESEDITILTDSDGEAPSGTNGKKKRTEGEAFGGTLLGGYSYSSAPSSSQSLAPLAIACPACTYENGAADVECAMCGTPLPNTT
ncbi:hypothetical protein V8D89_011142 [Ganoderma adspersum]